MPASPAVRPLPPRPSLEYEKKEAKRLLRRLRAGDPDALARARAQHPALASDPSRIRLADAQLVLAREYGFASWPRLVRWFGDVERQQRVLHPHRYISHPRQLFEGQVRRWRAELRGGDPVVRRMLAAYVPRFYGMRPEEVPTEGVTDDELRLAEARQNCAPSWEVLIERAEADARRFPRTRDWLELTPRDRAARAIAAADLDTLRRVTEAHPELLRDAADDAEIGMSLMTTALHGERKRGEAAMRPIVTWLVAQGFDLQRTLNVHLCGHMGMPTEDVRWLLDRGADPNWVAPNGIPVLEHALLRYWNGEAVDLVAARATPRKALWIAAGLGDVEGVGRFLDRAGRPTAAGRRLRPDFGAVTKLAMPALPDPDDEEILVEALFVASFNGRGAVIEYLASRGAPVNSVVYGGPILDLAVGNAWVPAVEALIRSGADPDLRGPSERHSARESAWGHFESRPDAPGRRRIAELCGLDPDAILAERDARPAPTPAPRAELQRTVALAADDARRNGRDVVRPENLLFGLLRGDDFSAMMFFRSSRMDLERFNAELGERARPAAGQPDGAALPLDPDAQTAMDAAVALAVERRQEQVMGIHVLHALLRDDDGPAAALLARYGASAAALREQLERAF